MVQDVSKIAGFRIRMVNFLQKNRIILVILLFLFCATLVLMGIFSMIHTFSEEKSAASLEKIQDTFTDYQKEKDETKKIALATTFEKLLNHHLETAALSYGLLKAYFIQGNYKASQEKWDEAAEAFREIFEKDQKHYLAPMAVVNQAVCLENSGKENQALEIINIFEKEFPTHLLAPGALFSQGRILESQKDFNKAKESYQKLLEQFPSSQWTKLAHDRLISLN